MINRRRTKIVRIGKVSVGGHHPISVQTMTNTQTTQVAATVRQIKQATAAGCELVRVAVPDMAAARALGKIKKQISIPLIADIHFDYRLALEAIRQGIDKLRINPGNIGSAEKISAVVAAAKKKKIPIRIGVNMGSLEKSFLKKYGRSARAMVASALRHIKILEKRGFKDIIIALKASDVERTVAAYRLLAKKVNYPFHVGVTEAGTSFSGTVKSSIGIGALLLDGIGDTIRVSLSGGVAEEIKVGLTILKSLGLRQQGADITSCPTCARATIAVEQLALQVESKLQNVSTPLRVAVMGCVVNGPGEAAEADIGITGSGQQAVIFKKGRVFKTVPKAKALAALLAEIKKMI
jgi:(E)-4-hydroxy-3-methylbut-2-enyl-diphosphate synthase